jgi:2-oxoglutarate dehydrogenase complex dehydrogenase (E1) component-like enzyme
MQLEVGSSEVRRQLGVRMMIDRYRAVAHQFAKTDPLEIYQEHVKLPGKLEPSALDIEQFGFTKENMQD